MSSLVEIDGANDWLGGIRWFEEHMPWRVRRLKLSTFDEHLALVSLAANDRDCEWLLVVTMPHAIVFWAGKFVPLWVGDVERICWQRARAFARDLARWSA